jgi:heat shock protein HslJ
VIDYLQSHITFTADGQVHGSGGCNNFTGGYTPGRLARSRD